MWRYNFYKTDRKRKREEGNNVYHKVNRGNIRRVLLCFFIHASRHLGSQFPNQGLNSHPPHWKHGVLTTGPPGKSRIRRDLYQWGFFQRWGGGSGICYPSFRQQVHFVYVYQTTRVATMPFCSLVFLDLITCYKHFSLYEVMFHFYDVHRTSTNRSHM